MKKMALSNVLIIGAQGLGVEIGALLPSCSFATSLHVPRPDLLPLSPLASFVAKNVILAGVKSVTIFDPSPVAIADLGTQYYLREADVGKPRGQVTVPRLAELNSYVPVHNLDGSAGEPLSDETLGKYQVRILFSLSIGVRGWVAMG